MDSLSDLVQTRFEEIETMLKKRFVHLLLGIACSSLLANAMVEDVCYPNPSTNHYKFRNCITLPANCSLQESKTTVACKAETFAAFLINMQEENPGRSLIHVDSTYLIAAAVGFAERDAYWIAAYDEATDLGTFTPRDVTGAKVNESELTTADIGGLSRTSYVTGGLLHHYLAVKNPGPEVDGLHPNVGDPNEIGIASLRTWAFKLNSGNGTSSTAAPLCAAGLTAASPSSACYNEAGQPVPITGTLSVVYPLYLTYKLDTGLQIISPGVKGPEAEPPASPVYSADFVNYIGQNYADAALGTYIHSLADRVSHHVCTDLSSVIGPLDGSRGFSVDMGNLQCSQLFHELRHLYETGVPFNRLESQDRTTEATLSIVYDELVAAARQRGVLKQAATNPASKAAFLASLLSALQVPEALDRMTALTQAGCAKGITPFPGAPACSSNWN